MSIVGIDAGATWIKAASFTDDLVMQDRIEVPSAASQGQEAYFDHIVKAASSLGVKAKAVGLCLPGTLSRDGQMILSMANVAGMSVNDEPISIEDTLGSRLSVTGVAADNDAGCAALAEWMMGRGQGKKSTSLLHITWGTGIGTGLVVDGVSQYGWEGGHLPVSWDSPNEEVCNCGSNIDLESYLGVPKLISKAKRWLAEGKYKTDLSAEDFEDMREASRVFLDRAKKGDELASNLIDDALHWLARGICSMGVLSYPDVITIGGGMMSEDWLLDGLRKHIAHEAHGYLVQAVKPEMVFRGSLGNDSGMVGAAVLAWQKFG